MMDTQHMEMEAQDMEQEIARVSREAFVNEEEMNEHIRNNFPMEGIRIQFRCLWCGFMADTLEEFNSHLVDGKSKAADGTPARICPNPQIGSPVWKKMQKQKKMDKIG